jgi:FkbM family methyltransferase
LEFNEADFAELSTIDAYSGRDLHGKSRSRGRRYEVRTISLNDLLAKYDAPSEIDYLSIDTEGSELEILKNLDFSRYSFRVISCEHNFTAAREEIKSLLEEHGYSRKLEEVSSVDDWYVKVP